MKKNIKTEVKKFVKAKNEILLQNIRKEIKGLVSLSRSWMMLAQNQKIRIDRLKRENEFLKEQVESLRKGIEDVI